MVAFFKGSGIFRRRFVVLMLFLSSSAFPHLTSNVARASTAYYSVNARSSPELRGLIKKLRGQGARVALTSERVEQPFFSVPARILNINGVGIQVFQYSSLSAAQKEVLLIGSNGMSVGASKPSWMAPPHFFRSGRMIVLYLGIDQTILKTLNRALGRQFAGSE